MVLLFFGVAHLESRVREHPFPMVPLYDTLYCCRNETTNYSKICLI